MHQAPPSGRVAVPTHLVTGLLGAGKTSAVRSLLAQRPPGARWAVLVNEFGSVGIDGALLASGAPEVVVREVAGGCICCSARVALRVALTRLLREVRPERLLIEPTGLGHPAGIFDVLAEPDLTRAIELRTVLCLVDPRQFADSRFAASAVARDQVSLADVLVANKTDLAGEALTAAFVAAARAHFPPKLAVVETRQGRVDAALLDLVRGKAHTARAHPAPTAYSPVGTHLAAGADVQGPPARGWVYPPDVVFDEARLRAAVAGLLVPGRWARAKGLFRVGRSWRAFNHAGDALVWDDVAWRRDSRIELIAHAGADPAWDEVESALAAAQRERMPPVETTS